MKVDGLKIEMPKWTVRKFLRVKIDGLKLLKWTVTKFLRVSILDGLKVDSLIILRMATEKFTLTQVSFWTPDRSDRLSR